MLCFTLDGEREYCGIFEIAFKHRALSIGESHVTLWFNCSCLPQVMDIARGLEYLHRYEPSIIHGDLKGVCMNISRGLGLYQTHSIFLHRLISLSRLLNEHASPTSALRLSKIRNVSHLQLQRRSLLGLSGGRLQSYSTLHKVPCQIPKAAISTHLHACSTRFLLFPLLRV